MRWVLLVLAASLLVGCASSGVSEADMKKQREEFSQDNYEKQMKAMGKEKELEEEKARAAERAAQEAASATPGVESQDAPQTPNPK